MMNHIPLRITPAGARSMVAFSFGTLGRHSLALEPSAADSVKENDVDG